MDTNYFQQLFADRIGGANYGKGTPVYKFEKIKQTKDEAKRINPNVSLIDMGLGEPDAMAFSDVVQALQAEVALLGNRGYADNSGSRLLQAAASYMHKTYGVFLDPKTEILHSMGSKSALSILPACFINPGDIVITTSPGYPVFATHAEYYGGMTYKVPLIEENHFLPRLDYIPFNVAKKAKILVLNYPNNPTGAIATYEFYEKAIQWAKDNQVIIIQDAAYGALVYNKKPLSILNVPGGKNVALELHSLSKAHNMTGWRIGWVCGNSLLVRAYGDVKNNTDSGQFLAIQNAAAQALDNPAITQSILEKYSRRMDLLVSVLCKLGLPAKKSPGTFFIYCKSPKTVETDDGNKVNFDDAEAFSHWLIKKHLISSVPWDDVGSYIRFSLTFDCFECSESTLIEKELFNRLKKLKFIF